ncbi:MAG: sigma-70 family RNA polymerase sigma factor [Chloroflexi bacterium]|nr:sigma-70 family RNA polymerase sigma factor [Chloroflexota bacterium]
MITQHWYMNGLLSFTSSASEADWETLYATELPRVYNFFRYRVGDDALAEDLTSTTFEKAWRSRQRYRRDLAAFSTWLFTIARNVAIDYYRQRRVELSLDDLLYHTDETDNNAPEQMAERQDEFARLSILLARLPGRERELLAMKYGAELTNRDIARITGLSESNVGTILHRTVHNLRAEWDVVRARRSHGG